MTTVDRPVALVTGSSSGIGAACGRALAARGAAVAINASRSAEDGRAVADELADGHFVQADVSDPDEATRLVEDTVAHYGRLDILINNAGRSAFVPHSDLAGAPDALWRRIFDVNVFGTWNVITAAVPHLQASDHRGACIVNVSSVAGSRPFGSSLPYAVSKAAVEHMTRLLAASLGPGIRVNAVAPGLVNTPWTAGEDFDEARSIVSGMAPLQRVGETDDVASAVMSVIDMPYTTGQVLYVDGGMNLR